MDRVFVPLVMALAMAACSTNSKPLDEAAKRAPVAKPDKVIEGSGKTYGQETMGGAPAGPAEILTAASQQPRSPDAKSETTTAKSENTGVPATAAVPATAVGLSFQVPSTWPSVPAKGMRAAEYRLPGEGGEGELILFHFGAGQGGDAKSNLDRWIGQMTQPDGSTSASHAAFDDREVNGLKITTVVLNGTYTASMVPGSSEKLVKPGSRLWGAVVEGPGGPWFWKAVGPEKTMLARASELSAFLASCRAGA